MALRRAWMRRHTTKGRALQTLDEMMSKHLLNAEQHAQIAAWVAAGKTPEAILTMPAPLWRALALASVLLNIDADLTQPPLCCNPAAAP